jgi:hypothetical protein
MIVTKDSFPENGILLAVDVGTLNTRASLFDIVDGSYRLLGTGVARTTAGGGSCGPGQGVFWAIRELEKNVGRVLLDDQEKLIEPATVWNSGIDQIIGTVSAGPRLKILLVGLLNAVSLESLRRLAQALYPGEIKALCIDDQTAAHKQIESFLHFRPDLILAAGGMDNGASLSILNAFETIARAYSLLPASERPGIVYAGNSALQEPFRDLFPQGSELRFAKNVRPSIDEESLDDALEKASGLYELLCTRQLFESSDFTRESACSWQPTAAAFGMVVRFLSKVQRSNKGVLGVDIGASTATMAAAYAGQLGLGTYPQMGLCQGLTGLLDEISIQALNQWISMPLPESLIREYILNKAIFPASLPYSNEELAIEHALAKLILQWMVKKLRPSFPPGLTLPGQELLPWFEPVVATGSVLTRSPTLGQTMLMLLDGLQPSGVTTLILDQRQVLPALGAIARQAPIITVQVLESTAFQHLATVVSPVGRAKQGSPILRLKIKDENGQEEGMDILQGSLVVIPLPVGQNAWLHLQPLQRFDIGMGGPGMSGTLRVVGGTLGVVIDARGRPLMLPSDPYRRYDLVQSWTQTLGS